MHAMLQRYQAGAAFDEMYDAQKNIRPHWLPILQNLEALGFEQLQSRQKDIDWRLEDNGVTYNVYNDPEGLNRPWRLDPIPFVIEADEWNGIEAGLKQRAQLMDLLFKDLYGEQKVIKNGIVPAEVIYSHKGFMREVYKIQNKHRHALMIYAADMARGPDGKMWVINDRTQAPSGLGYTLENRLTMNSAMPELYHNLPVRRLSGFFDDFKAMLHGLSPANRDNPLTVLLTPGPLNETYFEHAYLSSFLDLTLVQGGDLLSKNGELWLKSLKGLRRVDTVLRRVDDYFCDPLELRSDSRLGVAGLVQAVRTNSVALVNPLGTGILENLGLNPFMAGVAEYFLGESLKLPQIATWWCGQPKERDYVLEHLDRLIVKKIDRTADRHIYIGQQMNKSEKQRLREMIVKRPYLFVGQEQVEFSTTPSLVGGTIEPRNAVIRAYAIAQGNGYEVMSGGLVRVGAGKHSLMVSNQSGGSSKDLWILGSAKEAAAANPFENRPLSVNTLELIPSLRAENLFWLGRYLTRAIVTARMIRTVVKFIANNYRKEERSSETALEMMTKALTHVTMTYPGFLGEEPMLKKAPLEEVFAVTVDRHRVGSLSHTLTMLTGVNAGIKNLLSVESWRIFERMGREWQEFVKHEKPQPRTVVNALDRLLMHLMAYKELIDESVFAEQGLVLYDIGCGMEKSVLLISKARALLTLRTESEAEFEILEALLGSCESLNAYRAYYRSTLQMDGVIEFLLLNIRFPKSLISELDGLLKALPELPKFKNTPYLSRYEEPVFEAFSRLRLAKIETLTELEEEDYVRAELDALLADLATLLIESANELSKTYFAHYDE